VPWPKYRVWDKVPQKSTLSLETNEFPYSIVGSVEGSLHVTVIVITELYGIASRG